MTREKQIELLSRTCCEQIGFIVGAEWADENPKKGLVSIDKVCKWLENECDINDYLGGIFSGLCSINFNFEKLSKDLRKAMGE